MDALTPLETLYETGAGDSLPLPDEIARLYGGLGFPRPTGQPYVISNFVTTLDGVVSLDVPGTTDGDELSGSSRHDSMVMALLRAACDAVIVGANSLRKSSQHIWTAGHVYPELAGAFATLRTRLGKSKEPLNVFVSASGNIDPELPVFHREDVPSLIVTTAGGAAKLAQGGMPRRVTVVQAGKAAPMSSREILNAIRSVLPQSTMYMAEGGPHLIGHFFAGKCLDELFLTLSPQIAGRDGKLERLGLTAGRVFAPGQGIWGKLLSLKRAENHLFLRYGFEAGTG